MYTEKDIKVIDHSDVTGKFRGTSHQICKFNYRSTQTIFVIFHNLRVYDNYHVMTGISKFGEKINVIPNCLENI